MLPDSPPLVGHLNRVDAYRMIQRAEGLGVNVRVGRHTFRATGMTVYLVGGGTFVKRATDDRR
jgi:hypothetical protein